MSFVKQYCDPVKNKNLWDSSRGVCDIVSADGYYLYGTGYRFGSSYIKTCAHVLDSFDKANSANFLFPSDNPQSNDSIVISKDDDERTRRFYAQSRPENGCNYGMIDSVMVDIQEYPNPNDILNSFRGDYMKHLEELLREVCNSDQRNYQNYSQYFQYFMKEANQINSITIGNIPQLVSDLERNHPPDKCTRIEIFKDIMKCRVDGYSRLHTYSPTMKPIPKQLPGIDLIQFQSLTIDPSGDCIVLLSEGTFVNCLYEQVTNELLRNVYAIVQNEPTQQLLRYLHDKGLLFSLKPSLNDQHDNTTPFTFLPGCSGSPVVIPTEKVSLIGTLFWSDDRCTPLFVRYDKSLHDHFHNAVLETFVPISFSGNNSLIYSIGINESRTNGYHMMVESIQSQVRGLIRYDDDNDALMALMCSHPIFEGYSPLFPVDPDHLVSSGSCFYMYRWKNEDQVAAILRFRRCRNASDKNNLHEIASKLAEVHRGIDGVENCFRDTSYWLGRLQKLVKHRLVSVHFHFRYPFFMRVRADTGVKQPTFNNANFTSEMQGFRGMKAINSWSLRHNYLPEGNGGTSTGRRPLRKHGDEEERSNLQIYECDAEKYWGYYGQSMATGILILAKDSILSTCLKCMLDKFDTLCDNSVGDKFRKIKDIPIY